MCNVTMAQQRNDTGDLQEVDHEAEVVLLRRLEALERLVFGRLAPSERAVEPLRAKVEAIAKSVASAEGGSRDLKELAAQASHLGLLPLAPSATSPVVEHAGMKESIVLAARGEIEATARVLARVKTLQEHVNPRYLRDTPQLSARLSRLEGTYVGQATETAWINERAEKARLHYSQAVTLVSEKFVHWDDQVAELERHRGASQPQVGAPATS